MTIALASVSVVAQSCSTCASKAPRASCEVAVAKMINAPGAHKLVEVQETIDHDILESIFFASMQSAQALSDFEHEDSANALKCLVSSLEPLLVPPAAVGPLRAAASPTEALRDLLAVLPDEEQRLLRRLLRLLLLAVDDDHPRASVAAVWAPIVGLASEPKLLEAETFWRLP